MKETHEARPAPEVVVRAAEALERLRSATSRPAFQTNVTAFRRLMRSVVDYPAGGITAGDIAALTDIADRAIDAIEERLSSASDPTEMQLELAKTIYSIRHSLERVDRWHRHYNGV